jgi:hypothetical protein
MPRLDVGATLTQRPTFWPYKPCGAVEREFGRLRHDYGLAPLPICALERVGLHGDLMMLAQLSQALSRTRAVPLAA